MTGPKIDDPSRNLEPSVLTTWVDRYAPARLAPYLKLARLDRPIGTWLLLWPCWWSIALASAGTWPDPLLLALFAIGAIAMRGAGCTVNDIADHDLDKGVARTASRPIPSGAVSVRQAALFLIPQLAIGAGVLFSLNRFAILLGFASLALVVTYPFMKRITYWPQAWLGLTFNWGALLGWAAVTGTLDWPPVLLYAAGFFWTLGYDTIYAHQDKEDDLIVGVKSAALALGEHTRAAVAVFYAIMIALTATAGALAGLGWPFHVGLAAVAAHFTWQVATVDINDQPDCLTKFRSNRWMGWLLFAGIIAGQL